MNAKRISRIGVQIDSVTSFATMSFMNGFDALLVAENASNRASGYYGVWWHVLQ